MLKIKLLFLACITALLVGCSGGSTPEQPTQPPTKPVEKPKLLTCSISPASYLAPYEGENCSIYTTQEKDNNSSYQLQLQGKGDLVLWGGFTKKQGFLHREELVNLAASNPRFKYAYIYDELFDEDGQVVIGAKEQEIQQACQYVQSKGLKGIVTIRPDVVLEDNFKLNDINMCKVIALDPYPAAGAKPGRYYGEKFKDNKNTQQLHYAIEKLKQLGFTGDFWYIYQAFYVDGTPHEVVIEQFKQQQETLKLAQSFGVVGIAAFGYDLGPEELLVEPWLRQGRGSAYQDLIKAKF